MVKYMRFTDRARQVTIAASGDAERICHFYDRIEARGVSALETASMSLAGPVVVTENRAWVA